MNPTIRTAAFDHIGAMPPEKSQVHEDTCRQRSKSLKETRHEPRSPSKNTEKDEGLDLHEEVRKLRPGLQLHLDAALKMGRKARHHVLQSVAHMQDGGHFDAISHLEEALKQLNDLNYEVVDVMNGVDCCYLANEDCDLEVPPNTKFIYEK